MKKNQDNSFLGSTLISEEMRATKLFIFLFLVISILYDVIYYQILPQFISINIFVFEAYKFIWSYGLMFFLLIVAFYFFKKRNPFPVKYVFFLVYTTVNAVFDSIGFKSVPDQYMGGNIVEIIIILFAPIFVNKRFFLLVSAGTIFKYIIIGLAIQSFVVLLPIVLVFIFSIIAFLLLHRFGDYVKAISQSYRSRFEGIVKGIIAALELKDPYTRGHSERVAYYALTMAQRLQKYDEEELEAFYYSCLLHDVGKVNIPDSILTKQGPLTEEEYEIVKQHPVVGVEAIKDIDKLPNSIDVIRYHHERWDGFGYPDGLSGDDIPLLARVVAIADAFDAMTSDRSYREAVTPEEAYDRIIEGEGTQFDPELVDLFKEVYPIWAKLIDNYNKRKAELMEVLT